MEINNIGGLYHNEKDENKKEVLWNFFEATALALMESDNVWETPSAKIEDFEGFDEFEREDSFWFDGEFGLHIRYIAVCEFLYNKIDETSVGLGRKGDICGVDEAWVEIRNIYLTTPDGSEIEMTKSKAIMVKLDLKFKINN